MMGADGVGGNERVRTTAVWGFACVRGGEGCEVE